ncbi:MarR family winged helix-turn-helix transcriptional regulator [Paenibacillus agricola]|uniref:MarR family transcriptional regulator n=1 Tax=Paenibacillus agricola TaxID=2716264 RepID=A0ABX0J9R4_9BACL|nr:MarR family transcriptional regulator [Paenibacillus agricola]NHN30495.1 MarR family transcriptional regulator [Paenibacillus agricola]
MNREQLLKLENQFCFAIYAFSKEVIKLYRPILDKLGLTYTQYLALLVLWEQQSLTVKELGKKLYLDSGTLTPLLKKLEGMKLISRTRDPKDERSVIIKLTEQGQAMKEHAYEVPEQVFCQIKMAPEEAFAMRKRLTELLEEVHQTIQEE